MATRTKNVFGLLKEILWDSDDIEMNPTDTIGKSDLSPERKKALNAPIKAEEIYKDKIKVRTRSGIANVKPVHSDALAKVKQQERKTNKIRIEEQVEEKEPEL